MEAKMTKPITTITRNGNIARVYSHPNPTSPRTRDSLATLIVNQDAAPDHGLQPLETSFLPGYEIPSYAIALATLDDTHRPHRTIEKQYGTYLLTGNINHPSEINIAEAITEALRTLMPYRLVRFSGDGQLRPVDAIHYADGIMFMNPKRTKRNAPAWCDTPESLNNYAWAVLDNEYELLRQYYAGEIYTFTVNDEAAIDTREDLPEYIAFESLEDFIEDIVDPYLASISNQSKQAITVTTGNGNQVSGIPNAHLSEYRNTAEVFLDDALVSTYHECNDRDEAINMMLEDYGVAN